MITAFGHFVDGAGTILLGYGLQGVVMGGLCFLSWLLRKDRNNMFNLYCGVQDQRIKEATANLTALNANTVAFLRMTDALNKNSKS